MMTVKMTGTQVLMVEVTGDADGGSGSDGDADGRVSQVRFPWRRVASEVWNPGYS